MKIQLYGGIFIGPKKIMAFHPTVQLQINDAFIRLNNYQQLNNGFTQTAIFINDNNLPTFLSTVILGYNMHLCITGNGLVYHVIQNRLSSFHYSNILHFLHFQKVSQFYAQYLVDTFLRILASSSSIHQLNQGINHQLFSIQRLLYNDFLMTRNNNTNMDTNKFHPFYVIRNISLNQSQHHINEHQEYHTSLESNNCITLSLSEVVEINNDNNDFNKNDGNQ
ncbi:unnamed protein product [Cunninghamella blakesleeana]